MSGAPPFSVRIFIPGGEPEGLRTVEKSNWTGHGLVFPRAQFAQARLRQELKRTGVYILWGPGSGQLPRVYVGEGDPVLPRVEQHARLKDFWTHAVAFTSKDQNLNKAHVQYLEARLVELASEAKRAELDNGNVPQLPTLSEADTADAEGFLADLLLCLPVVGMSLFEKAKIETTDKSVDLILESKGIQARGRDTANGFVVRAGSQMVKDEVDSIDSRVTELRQTLLEQGVVVPSDGGYRLAQDYTFNSPSLAASVLLGAGANGRTVWKDSKGRTLKEIQEAEAT